MGRPAHEQAIESRTQAEEIACRPDPFELARPTSKRSQSRSRSRVLSRFESEPRKVFIAVAC
jgi:hypothetical protein